MVRAAPGSFVAGDGQIVERTQIVLPSFEVRGQLARDVRRAGTPGTFFVQPDTQVQARESTGCDAVVKDVLVEGVD